MKKVLILLGMVILTMWCTGIAVFAEKPASKAPGEADFKEHCAMCHPDGGNIINAKKSLHKKDMDVQGVKTVADIVKLIRKPGPGMTALDAKAMSDKEAGEIAAYILKTFK